MKNKLLLEIAHSLIPNDYEYDLVKKFEETMKYDVSNILSQLMDPVLFSKLVLQFMPYEYQQKLLHDKSKRICACMGRQTGKSLTIAAKAIHFATVNPRTTTLIISATLRQSTLMFEKVLNFIENSALRKSVSYRSRTRIKLSNGSWIIALPSGHSGATLRGFKADLIVVDEGAFIKEEIIASVAMPMLSTTNGYCWMLSTPWNKDHIFYKAFSNPSWSVYHLPTSINPLISKSFLEEQKELIGEERFAREYLAEFIDDSNAYFPMTLIRSCVDDDIPSIDGELFAGYDPGGKQSYAAFVIVRRIDDKLYMVYKKCEKGKSYAEFNVELSDLYKKNNFSMLVDETGLGNPIVEHVRELGIEVNGMQLTSRKKEELLSNLKILMESKKIVLPYDEELFHSLNAIEYKRNRVGNFIFEKRQHMYDDLAYALALACLAAKEYGVPGVIIKI